MELGPLEGSGLALGIELVEAGDVGGELSGHEIITLGFMKLFLPDERGELQPLAGVAFGIHGVEGGSNLISIGESLEGALVFALGMLETAEGVQKTDVFETDLGVDGAERQGLAIGKIRFLRVARLEGQIEGETKSPGV